MGWNSHDQTNSWYVGPEKGEEKSYRLLTDALEKRNRAAVAQLVSGGKEQLVLIRPYENGRHAHSLLRRRDPELRADPQGSIARVNGQELSLSQNLIERLSADEFDPDEFKDEYRLRVLAMLDEKAKRRGDHHSTIAQEPDRKWPVATIDLMQALKRSIEVLSERRPARSKTGNGSKEAQASFITRRRGPL
jgi:DNA end-binding protein Ku